MKLKSISVLLVVLVCLALVSPIQALEDGSPEAIVTDTLIVRPACFVVTVFGSVFFVVSLPFAAASKSVHVTADSLVVKPAYATFRRPLGDFSQLK